MPEEIPYRLDAEDFNKVFSGKLQEGQLQDVFQDLTRIIHGSVYYEAKLPAILGRPRLSVLTVSKDTAARLVPVGAQAWQPF